MLELRGSAESGQIGRDMKERRRQCLDGRADIQLQSQIQKVCLSIGAVEQWINVGQAYTLRRSGRCE